MSIFEIRNSFISLLIMVDIDIILSIIEEMDISLPKEYLSEVLVNVVKDRLNFGSTFKELKARYGIRGNTALSHCLLRTCKLEHGWRKRKLFKQN